MPFSKAIYRLFRANCSGHKSAFTCSRRNSIGSMCPGVVAHGDFSSKNVLESKLQGGNCPREISWGAIVKGIITQVGIIQG